MCRQVQSFTDNIYFQTCVAYNNHRYL